VKVVLKLTSNTPTVIPALDENLNPKSFIRSSIIDVSVMLNQKLVERVSKQFNRGLITEDERYNAVVEIWTDAKDQIQRIPANCVKLDALPRAPESLIIKIGFVFSSDCINFHTISRYAWINGCAIR
jgi:hypothetical protein